MFYYNVERNHAKHEKLNKPASTNYRRRRSDLKKLAAAPTNFRRRDPASAALLAYIHRGTHCHNDIL